MKFYCENTKNLSTFASPNPDTQQLRAKATSGRTVPSWLGIRYRSFIYCCVIMSEINYQLYAWTENGEVKFSKAALWEQEMLLRGEVFSVDSKSRDWECYSRLAHLYWQWGMLLLDLKEYWDAYDRFHDGLFVCRDAIWFLDFPIEGGINPFLLAMDDLFDGCHKAVLENNTLEELFYEDSFYDIKRQLWAIAPIQPEEP